MSTNAADADELGLYWEEDTIYSEAKVDPADIIYEGSDDEYYTSPEARKKRYIAAGYRFLQGRTPVTLSTSLRGPFEFGTGWKSPWASKSQSCGGKCAHHDNSPRRTKSLAATKHRKPLASQESHLPSPESLKQASVASTPRRIDEDEDELTHIQQWRCGITGGHDGGPRVSILSSAQKRKSLISHRAGSMSAKRRKIQSERTNNSFSPSERTERFLLSQPPRRGCRAAFDDPLKISFSSAPGLLQAHSPPPESNEPIPNTPKSNSQPIRTETVLSPMRSAAEILTRAEQLTPDRNHSIPEGLQEATEDDPEPSASTEQEKPNKVTPATKRRSSGRRDRIRAPITPSSMVTRSQRLQASRKSDQWSAQEDQGRLETRTQRKADLEQEVPSASTTDLVDSRPQEKSVFQPLLQSRSLRKRKTAAVHNRQARNEELNVPQRRRSTRYVTPEPVPSSELSDLEGVEPPSTPEGILIALNSMSARRADRHEERLACETNSPEECTFSQVPAHVSTPASQQLEAPGTGTEDSGEGDRGPVDTLAFVSGAAPSSLASKALTQSSNFNDAAEHEGQHSLAHEHEEESKQTEAASMEECPTLESFQDVAHFSFSSLVSRLVPINPWSSLGDAFRRSSQTTVFPVEATQGFPDAKHSLDTPEDVSAAAMEVTLTSPLEPVTRSEQRLTEADGEMLSVSLPDNEEPSSTPQDTPSALLVGQAEGTLQRTCETVDVEMYEAVSHPVSSVASQDHTGTPLIMGTGAGVVCPMDVDTSLGGGAYPDETLGSQSEDSASDLLDGPSFGGSTTSRCKTPEPLFSFKSMASFISPSPKRMRRPRPSATFNTGPRASVKSALKSTWSARNTHRRVSWAPELGEGLERDDYDDPSANIHRGRQASPPPAGAVELAANEDSKFQQHFSVMSQRRKEVNGSADCRLQERSRRSIDMAVSQAATDEMVTADTEVTEPADGVPHARDPVGEVDDEDMNMERGSSEEPMDIVEDVFNEMADFLQTWDVDAELEIAKKTSEVAVV
ncbi:hypothetical protein LIA77_00533 [Sarocladium implicatum]|nr:hypothetical protein LIA77_00533 [Sarocladium implicatum]